MKMTFCVCVCNEANQIQDIIHVNKALYYP